jgi:hypothetical protein
MLLGSVLGQIPSAPLAVKLGHDSCVIRLTLHQINDHRIKIIPSLNPHSGASDVANDDVDAGSRWSKVDRGHRAELWRAFFVHHSFPFRIGHFRIRFRYLHGRVVNPFQKGMSTRALGRSVPRAAETLFSPRPAPLWRRAEAHSEQNR